MRRVFRGPPSISTFFGAGRSAMGFDLIVGAVAVVGGAIAAVASFGIGSLLTPVLALQTGTKR